MWSKRRVINATLEFFDYICSRLGLDGAMAHDDMGNKFMVITAPEGSFRCVRLEPELLQDLMDGWDRKRAIWELKKELLMRFTFGDMEGTRPTEMSTNDFNYFEDVDMGLNQLLGEISY